MHSFDEIAICRASAGAAESESRSVCKRFLVMMVTLLAFASLACVCEDMKGGRLAPTPPTSRASRM